MCNEGKGGVFDTLLLIPFSLAFSTDVLFAHDGTRPFYKYCMNETVVTASSQTVLIVWMASMDVCWSTCGIVDAVNSKLVQCKIEDGSVVAYSNTVLDNK